MAETNNTQAPTRWGNLKSARDDAIGELGPYFGVPQAGTLENRLKMLGDRTDETTYPHQSALDNILTGLISTEGNSIVDMMKKIKETETDSFDFEIEVDKQLDITYAPTADVPEDDLWSYGGFNVYGEEQGTSSTDKIATSDRFADEGAANKAALIRDMLKPPSEGIVDYINAKPDAPTEMSPALSVIQIYPSNKSITVRNIGQAQIFFNAIPTIELNRCVPYFNLTVIGGSPAVQNQRISGMNLSRTLLGNVNVDVSADFQTFQSALGSIVTAADANALQLYGVSTGDLHKSGFPATAGMELFTAPQTIVPISPLGHPRTYTDPGAIDLSGNAKMEELGAAAGSAMGHNILDPFKPLASINDFTVNVMDKGGGHSFKEAALTLLVHDRSRLHELAPLVRPDITVGGRVQMMIEYGWSHPDGDINSTNSYGKFLNGMRARDMYRVSESTMKIERDGQARVSIKLHTPGGRDLTTIMISASDELGSKFKAIEDLIEAANVLADRIDPKLAKSKGKAISAITYLRSMRSTSYALNLSKAAIDTLMAFVKKYRSSENPAINDLSAKIEPAMSALASLRGKTGSIHKALQNKFARITSTPDPFLRNLTDGTTTKKGKPANLYINPSVDTKKLGKPQNYISLGKLLTIFVGEPIAASKKFAEIQFVFYSFNAKAGFVRDFNLAQFPIHTGDFKRWYRKQIEQSGNDMPLSQFMELIRKYFVSNQAARPYGMFPLYGLHENGYRVKKDYKKDTDLQGEIDKVMNWAYQAGKGADGEAIPQEDQTFTLPSLSYRIECIPIKETKTPKERGTNRVRTMLRMHVFDRVNSGNKTLEALLRASADEHMGVVSKTVGDAVQPGKGAGHGEEYVEAIKHARASGIVKPLSDKVSLSDPPSDKEIKATRFKIACSFNAIKNFVSLGMPSIRYGANSSVITDLSVSTMNSGLLANVAFNRGFRDTQGAPPGQAEGDVPMQVAPLSLTMKCLGNPLVEFAQQYFIDLQTGTSADNIYLCHKITHTLSKGTFDTSLVMYNMDAFRGYKSAYQNTIDLLLMADEFKTSSAGGTPH